MCRTKQRARRKMGSRDYLEADGQRIVLDCESDVVARPEQFHDGFLMGRTCYVRSVHFQDSVAHSQLAAQCGDALRNDLNVINHQSVSTKW